MIDPSHTETRNYWRASLAIRRLLATPGYDPDEMEDHSAELEAIALHTENPHLRVGATRLLLGIAMARQVADGAASALPQTSA